MTERMQAIVGARISEFERKMAKVKAIAKTAPRKIVVEIEARVDKFQKKMDRLAKTINSFTTIGANMRTGGLMAALPAISPLIAGLVAVIGGVGPMIGVMAGGLMGLASAFTAAGAGAAGFAAVAIPSINGVVKTNKELLAMQKKAQEYMASGEMDKYREQMAKIKKTQDGLSKSQLETIKTLRDFKKFYLDFAKQFQTPVLNVFNNSMKTAKSLMKAFAPTIEGATKAISGLLQSFNESLKAADVQNIFKWLGESAGPAITALGKAFGYMGRGILNMMAAFNPLAVDVQNGFVGMMKRFSEWAAGLSKSEKFNQFMDYVRTNGPKLLKIFGNITTGLVGMFAAFAPMSSDMMSGLVELTGKFKTWATNLKNSESFKNFIDYVKTNGPTMVSVIGQIVMLVVNLLQGMAPLGAKILEIAKSFLTWTNNMMDAHPVIGQIVAAGISIIGVLTSMIPFIIGWRVAFGGAIKFIWSATSMLRMNFVIGIKMMIQSMGTFIINVVKMAGQFILWMGKMIVQSVVWTGKMVWSLTKIIAKTAWAAAKFAGRMALMGAKYAWLAAKALFSAARIAAAWFIALGPVGWVIAVVIALVALIIANWDTVKKFTIKIWRAVVDWVVKAWKWIVDTVKNAASTVWNWIKDKFTAAKALSDKIHNAIWDKIHEVWNKIVDGIKDAMNKIVEWVKDKFNDILSFWTGLGSSFYKAGKGLIDQMANGIENAADKVIGKVKSLAQKVRDFLPFSPAKTGPLSDIDKLNFGGPIADSIGRARSTVRSALSDLLQVPDLAVSPSISGGGSIPIKYDTKDKDITASLTSALESMVLDNTIEIDGEAVVKATGKPMMRYMGQETKKASRRTGGR